MLKIDWGKLLRYTMIFCIILVLLDINTSNAAGVRQKDINSIFNDIKYWYGYGTVACSIMSLGAFIYNIIRLGTSSTNAQQRQMAIRGLMISGSVTAILPVSYLFYGIIVKYMMI